ncbi:5,10-methylenetetrahydrofolate reductase (NAD(P)) [Oscillospiraceae bacterium]|nr:5,10-methylenetetrahydrofolate reductase (NAD(P)) [Oscillospiraceae bacterium]
MKIIDILSRNEMSLSFEVFPPKVETSFENVMAAAGKIAELKPSFMSVTYGAGGGTSKYTLKMSSEIEHRYDVPMLAHLTCISSDKATVRERITELKEAGIHNIMALRGDIPADRINEDRSHWDYNYAVELISEIKSIYPDCCIGAACYPEVHPESSNQREDIRRLKEKVDAGADFLTTQMVFDNNLFFNFMYKLREAGVTVPVLPGIMPITKANQVERAIKLSGSFMPERFRSIVDRFGSDDAAMTQAGIIYATDQIIDLYANGITNVHVYSMNKPEVAAGIKNSLSSILGKEF